MGVQGVALASCRQRGMPPGWRRYFQKVPNQGTLLSKLCGEHGAGRGFAPCCHENNCAGGTLECGRSSYRLGCGCGSERGEYRSTNHDRHFANSDQVHGKAAASRPHSKALRAFSSSVVRRRHIGVCAERRSLSAEQSAEPPVSTGFANRNLDTSVARTPLWGCSSVQQECRSRSVPEGARATDLWIIAPHQRGGRER